MGFINKIFSCLSSGKKDSSQTQKGMKNQRQSADQNRTELMQKQNSIDPTTLVQQSNEEQRNQAIRKGLMKESQEVREVHIKSNELNQSSCEIRDKPKKITQSQIKTTSKYQENNDANAEGATGDGNNVERQNEGALNQSVRSKKVQSNEQDYSEKKTSMGNNNNNNSTVMNNNSVNIQLQNQSKLSLKEDNTDNINTVSKNNSESVSTSQSQIRTKGHRLTTNITEQGSLDSTKVSLNGSTVTNKDECVNSQEEYANIDRQIKFLKTLDETRRAIEEEKIINHYIQNQSALAQNALCFIWAQQYSDCIKKHVIFNKPIDNRTIADKDGNILQGKQGKKDYLPISDYVWYFLTQLYGGGPHVIIDNDPTKLKKLIFKPYRLENNSNFCYMNACLQTVLSIGEMNTYFRDKLYQDMEGLTRKKKFKFSIAYTDLIEKFARSNSNQIISPHSFKKFSSQNFDPYEQHDAQEYLRFVLGEIQDELNFPLPAKRPTEFQDSQSASQFYFKYHTSIVDRLFCGQLISKVECQKCKYVSSTFDPFLDLSLPIESKNLKDITSCMDNFFKPEEIDGDYKCEKCKKTSRAQKSCQLGKIPRYLVIHLKRFKMFPMKTKIKQQINYPAQLDIAKHYSSKNESTKYSLMGVIIHSGTAEYGHYISFNKRGDQWFYCDDESIQECELKDVLEQEAYLLFYEKIEK